MATEGTGGIAGHQRRDRRECETLCTLLDKLALGQFLGLTGRRVLALTGEFSFGQLWLVMVVSRVV